MNSELFRSFFDTCLDFHPVKFPSPLRREVFGFLFTVAHAVPYQSKLGLMWHVQTVGLSVSMCMYFHS
jgi:hypothetical protein